MLQMPVSSHIISRKIIAVYEIKVPESIAGIRTAGIDETLNHYLPEHTELGKDKKLPGNLLEIALITGQTSKKVPFYRQNETYGRDDKI